MTIVRLVKVFVITKPWYRVLAISVTVTLDIDTQFCKLILVKLASLFHFFHSFKKLQFLFVRLSSHCESGLEHICFLSHKGVTLLLIEIDFIHDLLLIVCIGSADSFNIF
jgi:hypothetical protein